MKMSKHLKDSNGDFIHREYWVEDSLYYSSWILTEEENPEDGVQKFLESKDWTWYEVYYEVKYKSHITSKDGLRVDISVREMNAKELRKARK